MLTGNTNRGLTQAENRTVSRPFIWVLRPSPGSSTTLEEVVTIYIPWPKSAVRIDIEQRGNKHCPSRSSYAGIFFAAAPRAAKTTAHAREQQWIAELILVARSGRVSSFLLSYSGYQGGNSIYFQPEKRPQNNPGD